MKQTYVRGIWQKGICRESVEPWNYRRQHLMEMLWIQQLW